LNNTYSKDDTIVALATPPGAGAIAVIRISGPDAFGISDKIFSGKKLSEQPSHTAHFGLIKDGEVILDEVVATTFKTPKSFTKENDIEMSCHDSSYIVKQSLKTFLKKWCSSGQTRGIYYAGIFEWPL